MLSAGLQHGWWLGASLLILPFLTHLLAQVIDRSARMHKLRKFPLAGYRSGEWSDSGAFQRLKANSRQVLIDGSKMYPDGFQVASDTGRMLILPPRYSTFLCNDKRLTLVEPLQALLRMDLEGGEGLREIHQNNHDLFVGVLRRKLTSNSAKLNEEIAEEAANAFDKVFGDRKDWNTVDVSPAGTYVISRLTTRLFLGSDLSNDSRWLRIISGYVINFFLSSRAVRPYPSFLARLIQPFLSATKKVKTDVAEARQVLRPLLTKRFEELKLAKQGLAPKSDDSVTWFEEMAKGKQYDAVAMQLGTSAVAIHTTTDLLCQALLDIAAHPDIIEPLRAEARRVKTEYGWTTAALQQMKLMDSVLKETQRMKPIGGAPIQRYAREDVVLPDGVLIPKGTFLAVSTFSMWDSEIYKDPAIWDPYRFLNLREQSIKNGSWTQLVATSPEHVGFGHGLNACPGRFIAAMETKVAISHVLLNYDIEGVGEDFNKPMLHGLSEWMSNPWAKLRVRRRAV